MSPKVVTIYLLPHAKLMIFEAERLIMKKMNWRPYLLNQPSHPWVGLTKVFEEGGGCVKRVEEVSSEWHQRGQVSPESPTVILRVLPLRPVQTMFKK